MQYFLKDVDLMCALVVLAGNFDILSGKASFTVPEVIAGNDWSVVRE